MTSPLRTAPSRSRSLSMALALAWPALALALVSLLATTLAACLAPKRVERLDDALRSYNESVRWQRFDTAAARLPPDERDAFIDTQDALSDELRISEYEVVRVRYDDTGRRVKVQIKYVWHLDSRGVVHTTHTVQRWERPGKMWMLLSEHRLRGDEMPGIPEPPEDARDPAPAGTDDGPTEPDAEPDTEPDADLAPAPAPDRAAVW